MMIREASQGQHSNAPHDDHYWEAADTLDMHVEAGSFLCDLENGCSLYQVVQQCGSVRVYSGQFCLHDAA